MKNSIYSGQGPFIRGMIQEPGYIKSKIDPKLVQVFTKDLEAKTIGTISLRRWYDEDSNVTEADKVVGLAMRHGVGLLKEDTFTFHFFGANRPAVLAFAEEPAVKEIIAKGVSILLVEGASSADSPPRSGDFARRSVASAHLQLHHAVLGPADPLNRLLEAHLRDAVPVDSENLIARDQA